MHHMHNVTESSGRIGECSDGLMGGDIDGCGGRVEPAACKASAAAAAASSLTSPSKIVLSTPIRRAIA